MGKALALDTPSPPRQGWTTMGDVQVGDQVLGSDGPPTTVVAATEVMHERPCYEVTFDDGPSSSPTREHQWLTDTGLAKSAQAAPRAPVRNSDRRGRTHGEIAATLRSARPIAAEPRGLQCCGSSAARRPNCPSPPIRAGCLAGRWHSAAARDHHGGPRDRDAARGRGLRVARATRDHYALQLLAESFRSRRLRGLWTRSSASAPGPHMLPVVRGPSASVGPVLAAACTDCGVTCSGGLRCQTCRLHHGTFQALLRSLGVLGTSTSRPVSAGQRGAAT